MINILNILALVSFLLITIFFIVTCCIGVLQKLNYKSNIIEEIEIKEEHCIKIYFEFCSSLISKKFDNLKKLCHESFLQNFNLIGSIKPSKLEYYKFVKSKDNLFILEIYSRDCLNSLIGDRVHFKKISNNLKILQIEGIE